MAGPGVGCEWGWACIEPSGPPSQGPVLYMYYNSEMANLLAKCANMLMLIYRWAL